MAGAVVKNDFGRIAAMLPVRAAEAVTVTAEQIAEAARAGAPFGIGATISVEHEDPLHDVVVVGEWWGGFWEYGTRDFAARPYLTPAAETARARFFEQAGRAVRP